MIVLVPAFEPTRHLLDLLRDLAREAPELSVVVVDDDSGPLYAPLFSDATRLGADVIGYADSRGKGAALKHGFAHIARHYPGQDVVCAGSTASTRWWTFCGSGAPCIRVRWCWVSVPSPDGCPPAVASAT